MSNTVTVTKWWQGTNFWMAALLAIGGLFVGFPEGEAKNVVEWLFGIIASIGMIREKVKGVDWKAWITSKNTWNYIATALAVVLPNIPVDLFTRLNEIAIAALGGNFQGLIAGLFSLGTIIYFWVTGGKKKS